MPSVLIETGYLSNKKENSFLMTDAGRSEIAHSIYGSLVNYLNKIDIKENLTIIPEHEVTAENIQTQSEKITKPVVQEKPVSVESGERVSKKEDKSVTAKAPVVKKEPTTNNQPKVANERQNTSNVSSQDNTTTYAIQIGVFSKRIEPGSKFFKGVFPLRELIQEGRYKYFCFESNSLQTTRMNFSAIKAKFPDAFLVSIKNNQIRVLKDETRKK
jgi:N-acetylmuramoyl-L-alanine amidase